jgi:hypothetical protein
MAGRKLTDAEKAEFARRNAISKQITANDKAKKSGVDAEKIKAEGRARARSAEQIMADIEKAKQDPKFQKKMEQFRASQAPKGSQADHHITAGANVSKGLSSGGVLGLALSGMASYNEEAKKISDAKKQASKQVN